MLVKCDSDRVLHKGRCYSCSSPSIAHRKQSSATCLSNTVHLFRRWADSDAGLGQHHLRVLHLRRLRGRHLLAGPLLSLPLLLSLALELELKHLPM